MTIRTMMIVGGVVISMSFNMPIALATTGHVTDAISPAQLEAGSAKSGVAAQPYASWLGTAYCMMTGQGNQWLGAYYRLVESPDHWGAVLQMWEGGCVV